MNFPEILIGALELMKKQKPILKMLKFNHVMTKDVLIIGTGISGL